MKKIFFLGLCIILLVVVSGCTTDSGTTGEVIQEQSKTDSGATGEAIQEESKCVTDWRCTEWSRCSSSGRQSRTCTDNNNCGTTIGKPILVRSCTYVALVGDPVTIGDLKYIVIEAGTVPILGTEFMYTEPDGVFLIMTLSIENVGKDSEYLSASSFELTDYKDRKYDVDTGAQFYLSMMGYEILLFDKLGPGLTTEGNIVFDVPPDDKEMKLVISGGFLSGVTKEILIGNV